MKDLKQAQQGKKNNRKDILAMAVVLAAAAIILLIFPHKAMPVLTVSGNYLMELVLVLPAVMVIIGLFSVWIPDQTVVKYMGHASGIKGIFLSLALVLPYGPCILLFLWRLPCWERGPKGLI